MTHTSGAETPVRASFMRSNKLSLASARLTTECLVYADLCSSNAYVGLSEQGIRASADSFMSLLQTSAPLVTQPIYVAALAFLHEAKLENFHAGNGTGGQPQSERENSESAANNTEAFLASLHKQSLTTLSKALQRIEWYWAGAAYATNILAQRESGKSHYSHHVPSQEANAASTGLGYFRIDPSLNAKRAAISLPDHGLLKRFQTNNPTVNPATETSLRESMAAEQYGSCPFHSLQPVKVPC